MAKDKYKVGLVGCGGRQRGHMDAFQEMPEVDVVACADFVEDLREKFSEEYGILHCYASAEEMFKAEDLDIATVVTAPKWRIEPVTQAAEAGLKGIICEKPFSIDMEEVDVMIEACEKSGTILVINHQLRFLEPIVRIKEAIDAGEIGEVEFYRTTSHVKIHGQGTHMIDLVRFLHNEKPFAWVMGSISGIQTFDSKVPGPDKDVAVFAFEDGVHLYLECGEQAPHRQDEPTTSLNCYIEAVGTRGRAWSGINKGYRLWTRDGKYIEEPGDYTVQNLDAQIGFVRELIESIETGKEHRNSARISRPTQEAIVVAIRSAIERKQLTFPVEMPTNYLAYVKKQMVQEG